MKSLTLTCFLLFAVEVVLFLIQMWFTPLRPELFAKLSITDAALFLIVFVINFLIKENRQTSKINDGSKLEE